MPWQQLLHGSQLTPEALLEAFRLALQASGSVASVSQDPSERLRCNVQTTSGKGFSVQLDVLYAEVRTEPPHGREAAVLRHVTTALDTARALEGSAPAPSVAEIVPTVKSASWLADALEMAPELASEPIAGDLVLVYAFDRPHSMAYATRSDLQSLGLSGDRLRATALKNLRARLPAELGSRGDGKSFMLLAGGNFESSLILLDEVWDQLRSSLRGDPVVCVVARDVCMVTSTGTHGGLESLLGARNHLCGQETPSHFVSTALLRRVGGRWVPFEQAS